MRKSHHRLNMQQFHSASANSTRHACTGPFNCSQPHGICIKFWFLTSNRRDRSILAVTDRILNNSDNFMTPYTCQIWLLKIEQLSKTCFMTHAYSIFSPRMQISFHPWVNILITIRQYLSFDTLQVHLWQELSHLPCFEHAAVSLSCLKVKCTCMCRATQLYAGAWDLHKVLISHKQHTRPVYFSSHRSNSEELWQFHHPLCMKNLTVENSPKSAS